MKRQGHRNGHMMTYQLLIHCRAFNLRLSASASPAPIDAAACSADMQSQLTSHAGNPQTSTVLFCRHFIIPEPERVTTILLMPIETGRADAGRPRLNDKLDCRSSITRYGIQTAKCITPEDPFWKPAGRNRNRHHFWFTLDYRYITLL